MHKNHAGYNTTCWNFFDRDRYKITPAGGEFSYYSDYDQEHVLDYPDGPYGKPYEVFARDFHITYIMGNDQPGYQTMQRIKEASMASGYRFKIVRLRTSTDSSVFEILNYGVAPIYYDAYIAVDGVRSAQSLKLLSPGDTLTCSVSAGAEDGDISIECDKLLESQSIQFYGTQELPITRAGQNKLTASAVLFPNPVTRGDLVRFRGWKSGKTLHYSVYNGIGKLEFSGSLKGNTCYITTDQLVSGLYFIKISGEKFLMANRLLVL